MKIAPKNTIIIALTLLVSISTFAAGSGGPTPPPPSLAPPFPPGVPINENGIVLVVLGILYSFFILKKKTFKKQENS
ncbi:hypothetical protein [Flavobacterium luminosum]|uniref:Signal peptidase n=1 Tax=Flavobacterium luminosum TaxID=2949086 RepID=A0ABT0TKU1_9FLAO|nr:hypothetical protein [Flavobacterium sp. HXWNR70]MCL9808115.1 hypothetical protein [Flavobacterium sp. HXWNR70]